MFTLRHIYENWRAYSIGLRTWAGGFKRPTRLFFMANL